MGYSPWGQKALDMTEQLNNNKSFYNIHGYQNIKLSTLYIAFICQLYLNKTEKKKESITSDLNYQMH